MDYVKPQLLDIPREIEITSNPGMNTRTAPEYFSYWSIKRFLLNI